MGQFGFRNLLLHPPSSDQKKPKSKRLSSVATDFDKKLSHVHRSTGATKPIDGAGAGGDTGLDTMAEAGMAG